MRIVLTHIPRTGGTSLFEALKEQLPEAKAVEFDSLSQIATMSDKELNSYEIISTYIGSKIFDRLDGSWTKIIIFREPITRLKSAYWYLRNSSEHMSFATPFAKSCGFREYLASRENAVTTQNTNVQIWTVLGDKGIFFRQKHAHLTANEIFEQSMSRLENYNFIGFTERLDEFWRRVCRHFKWPPTQLQILRKNPFLPDFEEASPEDLAFHTSLDFEFVRHARLLCNRAEL